MINIFKNKDKIIGIYSIYLNNSLLLNIKDIKYYLIETFKIELEKDQNSDLFTYNIIKIEDSASPDLLGKHCGILFELIPNKNLFNEFKIISERLQTGL